MKVGVPNQSAAGESRVAMTPDVVKRLSTRGIEVVVESGAGAGSHLPDAAFQEAGATIGSSEQAYGAEIVAVVRAPSAAEIERLSRGSIVIGFLNPLTDTATARALASAGAVSFAMEAIPRITRAQSMDALSSQATVSGYRAVLLAAENMDRFFPMLTTAAGTIKPATVLVLGAGVAGLQAIATARRLGAVVTGYDVRAAVREQVESLGARFLDLHLEADAEGAGGYAKELAEEQQRKQQEAMAKAIGRFDVVITTALVPGRRAPLLVTAAAVEGMKPGSVVVDLAASAGGNCELTEPGQTVERHDVKIVGALDLAAEMPDHASQLYARNVQSLLELLVSKEGQLELNWDDEILAGACITRDGEIVHEGAKQAAGAAAAQ
ncbi:MAG: H+-translocating transhydrogenase subunit alpha [Thermoleophilaceae bacterium]|jgi:NAD(P) transhydrogenase subunit alpha|nr:H+-translocating transhydrogenase subunit alpha [Thermoleophilaceae bacterium]